ncbi:MAG: phosphatase PAP2 family protein [Sphingobacteriales bacterium]|nr:phosphatase PAP2 family protein [Sphingobacteriales bacterium]
MRYFKSIVAVIILLFSFVIRSNAQIIDSARGNTALQDTTAKKNIPWQLPPHKKTFHIKSYIVPGLMMAYGFIAIKNDGLRRLNAELRDELYAEKPHRKFQLDNYLQFAPAALVYGLDAVGVKAKHNFRDRTMLFLMSNIILNASVQSIKKLSHQMRPDGSGYTSFPSGHTAEAFANAEFLRQEYKDVSPWYGVAGYAMAFATGYLRMYNNKHWFSDVVAGAGVGIISTKLAYWLYPKIQHSLFRGKHSNTVVIPTYQSKTFGVSLVSKF